VRLLRQGFAKIVGPALHQLQGPNGNGSNLEYSPYFRLISSQGGGDSDHAVGLAGYNVWLSPADHLNAPKALLPKAGNVGGEQGHPYPTVNVEQDVTLSAVVNGYSVEGRIIQEYWGAFTYTARVKCTSSSAPITLGLAGVTMVCAAGGSNTSIHFCGDCAFTNGGIPSFYGDGANRSPDGNMWYDCGGTDASSVTTWSMGGDPGGYIYASPSECGDPYYKRYPAYDWTSIYGFVQVHIDTSTQLVMDDHITAYDWTGGFIAVPIKQPGGVVSACILTPVVFADAIVPSGTNGWTSADSPGGDMGLSAVTRPIYHNGAEWLGGTTWLSEVYIYDPATCTFVKGIPTPNVESPSSWTSQLPAGTASFIMTSGLITPLIYAAYGIVGGAVVRPHSVSVNMLAPSWVNASGVCVAAMTSAGVSGPGGTRCTSESRNYECSMITGIGGSPTEGVCGLTLPTPCVLSQHVPTMEEPWEYAWYNDLPKNLPGPGSRTVDGVAFGNMNALQDDGVTTLESYAYGVYQNKQAYYSTVEQGGGWGYGGYRGYALPNGIEAATVKSVQQCTPGGSFQAASMCAICEASQLSDSYAVSGGTFTVDPKMDAYALEISEAESGTDYSGGYGSQFNTRYSFPAPYYRLTYTTGNTVRYSSWYSLGAYTTKIPLALLEGNAVLASPPLPLDNGPKIFGQLLNTVVKLEFAPRNPTTHVSSTYYQFEEVPDGTPPSEGWCAYTPNASTITTTRKIKQVMRRI